ncbi:MAG: hypothetical protein WCO06_05775 [Candidatus Roizmanbacteria bacterium]
MKHKLNKLPKSLITVTPLSKIIALILFITLPLICFYIGVQAGANACLNHI